MDHFTKSFQMTPDPTLIVAVNSSSLIILIPANLLCIITPEMSLVNKMLLPPPKIKCFFYFYLRFL